LVDLGRIKGRNKMSQDSNFQITIEGAFSERFIGTLEASDIADYLTLYGDSDQGFSDFCQEELHSHWSDLNSIEHENGAHNGSIIVEQNNDKIFHVDIEDLLEGYIYDNISAMVVRLGNNGFYYLRIEWEGKSIIQLEGEVDEDERDGWKEDFENIFSPFSEELGVLESIETYSSLGEIDLTEVDRPNPSGSDELIIARGNVGGKTKTIVGLAELSSIMEKDNVDLSDKEKITNYLNKFISE
jgi:hypothetical protein|tara:strand:- start:225 stop:950 length:726 start_codon:yes stop_codon:yes gene_type:complete